MRVLQLTLEGLSLKAVFSRYLAPKFFLAQYQIDSLPHSSNIVWKWYFTIRDEVSIDWISLPPGHLWLSFDLYVLNLRVVDVELYQMLFWHLLKISEFKNKKK